MQGNFDLNVTFEFDTWTMFSSTYNPSSGITFSSPDWGGYAIGSTGANYNSLKYMDHFIFGLNGDMVDFKNGKKTIYEVFKPISGQTVPILRPGEKRTVRIYL